MMSVACLCCNRIGKSVMGDGQKAVDGMEWERRGDNLVRFRDLRAVGWMDGYCLMLIYRTGDPSISACDMASN